MKAGGSHYASSIYAMRLIKHILLAVVVSLGQILCGLVALAASNPPTHSLDPPVLLPDGAEFTTWEQPLQFTRTYYVDASSKDASDANPGTQDRPFATINRAAQILQPGERVVVGAGVYREWIRPVRGGSDPEHMISYEAAPGATVVLKGSRIFKPAWTRSNVVSSASASVWEARLDPKLFAGYNPFAIDNVTPEQFSAMDWATPLRGKVPYTLPRGLVFEDGQLLRQVAVPSELLKNPGAYWVDRTNQVLHVRLSQDQPPANANIEITTQQTVFAPVEPGLGFIRVKGFTIEYAAGPFPWEQVGALSTTRGHHWLIEGNTVRWANGVGIDVGIQFFRWPQPPVVGYHIVRHNVVTDCGICGICGLGSGREFGLLIEENVLARNAFYDVERLYETAAIKTHNNVRCLIRRNLILDTRHGAGIWMDWNNKFSRCAENIILGSQTIHGGIFVEASYKPNMVDHNFIWGADGHGIYEHDSYDQLFFGNVIGCSAKSALHLHGKITDRRVDGRVMTYGHHTVTNNICIVNDRRSEFRGEPSLVTNNLEVARGDAERRRGQ